MNKTSIWIPLTDEMRYLQQSENMMCFMHLYFSTSCSTLLPKFIYFKASIFLNIYIFILLIHKSIVSGPAEIYSLQLVGKGHLVRGLIHQYLFITPSFICSFFQQVRPLSSTGAKCFSQNSLNYSLIKEESRQVYLETTFYVEFCILCNIYRHTQYKDKLFTYSIRQIVKSNLHNLFLQQYLVGMYCESRLCYMILRCLESQESCLTNTVIEMLRCYAK